MNAKRTPEQELAYYEEKARKARLKIKRAQDLKHQKVGAKLCEKHPEWTVEDWLEWIDVYVGTKPQNAGEDVSARSADTARKEEELKKRKADIERRIEKRLAE